MRIVQIPLLKDNYGYLLVCEKTNEAGIVDPSEGEPVWRRVQEEGVNLKAVLNTHHHRDHTGGNAFLLAQSSLRVYGASVDRDRIPGITDPLDEGDEVRIGEITGKVLFIPGHTSGHIAFLFNNSLFCGDTLFTGGCGRVFEGTYDQMKSSLGKLRELPGDTLVYCGHEYTEKNLQFALTVEPENKATSVRLEKVQALRSKGKPTVPSMMAEELDTNPFLRWESQAMQGNLKQRFPGIPLDPVSVFGKVRELKDAF